MSDLQSKERGLKTNQGLRSLCHYCLKESEGKSSQEKAESQYKVKLQREWVNLHGREVESGYVSLVQLFLSLSSSFVK